MYCGGRRGHVVAKYCIAGSGVRQKTTPDSEQAISGFSIGHSKSTPPAHDFISLGGNSKLYVLHRERHRSSAPTGHTTVRKGRRNRAARSTPQTKRGQSAAASRRGGPITTRALKQRTDQDCQTKPGRRTTVASPLCGTCVCASPGISGREAGVTIDSDQQSISQWPRTCLPFVAARQGVAGGPRLAGRLESGGAFTKNAGKARRPSSRPLTAGPRDCAERWMRAACSRHCHTTATRLTGWPVGLPSADPRPMRCRRTRGTYLCRQARLMAALATIYKRQRGEGRGDNQVIPTSTLPSSCCLCSPPPNAPPVPSAIETASSALPLLNYYYQVPVTSS